jgi:hypothetical protein
VEIIVKLHLILALAEAALVELVLKEVLVVLLLEVLEEHILFLVLQLPMLAAEAVEEEVAQPFLVVQVVLEEEVLEE